MTLLDIDEPTAEQAEWVEWQVVMNAFNTTTMLAAVLMNGFLLYIMLREQKVRQQDSTGLFINMAIVDLLVGAGNGAVHVVNAVGGGWVSGELGCAIGSFSSVGFCCESVWTMALIALEREMMVVQNGKRMGNRQYVYLALTWMLATVMGGGPLVGFGSITLHPSRTLCVSKWWSHSTIGALYTACNCLALMIPINISFLCYFRIYKFISDNALAYNGPAQPAGVDPNNAINGNIAALSTQRTLTFEQQNALRAYRRTKRQRATAKKMLVIPTVFMACWGFYAFLQLYELIKGDPLPDWYDQLALTGGFMNSMMNPLLVCYVNPTIWNAVKSRLCWGRLRQVLPLDLSSDQPVGRVQWTLNTLPSNVANQRETTLPAGQSAIAVTPAPHHAAAEMTVLQGGSPTDVDARMRHHGAGGGAAGGGGGGGANGMNANAHHHNPFVMPGMVPVAGVGQNMAAMLPSGPSNAAAGTPLSVPRVKVQVGAVSQPLDALAPQPEHMQVPSRNAHNLATVGVVGVGSAAGAGAFAAESALRGDDQHLAGQPFAQSLNSQTLPMYTPQHEQVGAVVGYSSHRHGAGGGGGGGDGDAASGTGQHTGQHTQLYNALGTTNQPTPTVDPYGSRVGQPAHGGGGGGGTGGHSTGPISPTLISTPGNNTASPNANAGTGTGTSGAQLAIGPTGSVLLAPPDAYGYDAKTAGTHVHTPLLHSHTGPDTASTHSPGGLAVGFPGTASHSQLRGGLLPAMSAPPTAGGAVPATTVHITSGTSGAFGSAGAGSSLGHGSSGFNVASSPSMDGRTSGTSGSGVDARGVFLSHASGSSGISGGRVSVGMGQPLGGAGMTSLIGSHGSGGVPVVDAGPTASMNGAGGYPHSQQLHGGGPTNSLMAVAGPSSSVASANGSAY